MRSEPLLGLLWLGTGEQLASLSSTPFLLLISAAAPRSVEADEGAHCLLLGPAGAYLDETQIPLSLCSGPCPAALPCSSGCI